MKYVIHTLNRVPHGSHIADIADIELHLARQLRMLRLQVVTHIILLLLIPGENTDLCQIGIQEMLQYRGAEGAGSTRNHKCLVFEKL